MRNSVFELEDSISSTLEERSTFEAKIVQSKN